MKVSSMLKLGMRVLYTILFRRKEPVIGSIILTDRCNLSCRHCAVNNITGIIYPYSHILSEMQSLYEQGVRILILYGGEPFLWNDAGRNVRDLVREAKEMGFLLVNVITNGTFTLDIPEADLILVSIDGGRENHNRVRGDTYDRILTNIANAPAANLCMYMAINRINLEDIEEVCSLAAAMDKVRAISFNFHTPYPGTEHLKLSIEEKQDCCNRIEKLLDEGYPILNLRCAFPYIIHNNYKTPCYQCVIVEDGRQWVCGRCIDIEGLCEECGFFFPAEYSLVFNGNLKAGMEMVRTYLKYFMGRGRFFPFRMVMRGTAAYTAGAAVACLLYILFAMSTGFGQDTAGVVFLLATGTAGAFLGGFLLNRSFRLAALSALVEAAGITVGAVLLFFVMAAEANGSGLPEFLVFSVLGLSGVTVMDAVHGALLAGYLYAEKPRRYFAMVSAGMALACGIVCGLPYLWIMSGLPMSYRGIEYQMLVPVLITIVSFGMTAGLCIGTYSKTADRYKAE